MKTVRFETPTYLGDATNIVRIFNEKDVDELVLLDITATLERRPPRTEVIRDIASECFMPMAYGGGIQSVDEIREIIGIGVEKAVLNSATVENPRVVEEAARAIGSQSVVVSIDVRTHAPGREYEVYTRGGRQNTGLDPVAWAKQMADRGAGEILLTSIDRDGTMTGYDLALIRAVVDAVDIPVVACGGAGNVAHLADAVLLGGASAVAAGSMFVFHGKHRAVLINTPPSEELDKVLAKSPTKAGPASEEGN